MSSTMRPTTREERTMMNDVDDWRGLSGKIRNKEASSDGLLIDPRKIIYR